MTRTLSADYKKVATATIVFVCALGVFATAPEARASSDTLVTKSLPGVHATTQLVLGALSTRISADPQVLASASRDDAQITALMKLLEQLMAMYQAILAAQGGESDSGDDDWDDDVSDSRTPVITSASLHKGSGTSYIRVKSRYSKDVIKLEYSANCCKSTEGTLDPWKANSADEGLYLLDTYLGNVKINNLKIRMVTSGGVESRWFEVAVDDDEDDEPSITVKSPNGGEELLMDSGKDVDFRVTWRASRITGDSSVNVYLKSSSGNTCRLGGTRVGAESFPVTLSYGQCPEDSKDLLPGRYKILLVVEDRFVEAEDVSDRYFTLVGRNSDSDNEPSITVLSPNGGETYVTGESMIPIRYTIIGAVGEAVTAYLYHPEKGNSRSVNSYVSGKDVEVIDMYLAKGDVMEDPGNYKVNLCAHSVQTSDGKDLCDSSDNYFTLTN